MPRLRKTASEQSAAQQTTPSLPGQLGDLIGPAIHPPNIGPGPEGAGAPQIVPEFTSLPPAPPSQGVSSQSARSTQRPAERTSAPSRGTASPDFSSPNVERSQAAPSQPKTPTPMAALGQGAGDGTPSVFNPLPLPDPNTLANPPAPSMTPGPAPTLGEGDVARDSIAGGLLGGGLGGPESGPGQPDISPLLLALMQLLGGGR